MILVQGVVKYLYKLKMSKLDKNEAGYNSLYLSKDYEEKKRQVKKHLAKTSWFKNNVAHNEGSNVSDWKRELPKGWRGNDVKQRCVAGMNYTSVLQIPNTGGAVLFRKLIEEENKLAKLTGYNVKIVECSGIQLVRLFPRTSKQTRCHWDDCAVCLVNEEGSSKCRTRNLVYEGICLECEEEVKVGARDKDKAGIYIGESSRSLAERALEHVR